jgi:hypothetical protein
MPVPVRLTKCGLAASGLAPIATDADSGAAALGLKVTPTWHDAPPASVAPHGVIAAVVSEKSPAFAPLIIGVGSVSAAVPRLATVTVSAFDLVSATVPNASVVAGVSLTGVTPVPDIAIKCGLVGS